VPVRVTAASVGIAAAVDPVGVDPAGDVAIPERVDTVGWYRFGARPGMAHGSTVLVGHVDSAVQGIGAFFHLHEIERGARLTVKLSSGAVAAYRVIAREEFPKGSVPLGALFSLTGAPRLTLITCGGSFDAHARSYRDNVVVTAVPG
jgi:sortase (surface protein transpeptidase)